MNRAVFLRFLSVLGLLLAMGRPLGAAFDPVSWDLGGLRGVAVGPASDQYPFQSEGTTFKLKDGALVHAFNLRFGEKDMANWHPHYARTVIAKVTSTDGGRTWTAPEIMFASDTGSTASHPAVRRLPNGELGATYNRINAKPLGQWNRKAWITSVLNADKVFRYSQDEGKTWSREILISPAEGYWTSAHDRLLVLSNGRLLQPLHCMRDFAAGRSDVVSSKVARSDDNGRTWQLSKGWLEVTDLAPGYTGTFKSNYHEVAIAERADGSVFMIGRTSAGRLYSSVSVDHGETWTRPAPTSILSPEAPANIARVPGTDDLLIVWNSECVDNRNTQLGQRLTLSTMLSSDGGASWHDYREFITIPPNPANQIGFGPRRVCYPSIFFDQGQAYIGYWAGAKVGGRQLDQEYMAVVPVAWFYALQQRHRPGAFTGPEPDPVYPMQSDPLALLTTEEAFRPFAKAVGADAARLLEEPGVERSPDQLKLLLAIRVHLALHYRDTRTALAMAERIRDLQTDPRDRAFAGVTAEALVAAERATGQSPGSHGFEAVFAREFRSGLAALPATAAMGHYLREQRAKNADFTPEKIQRDLLARLGSGPESRGAYTLAEADQIVRAHHRLADLCPIEPSLISALDAAITARSTGQ